MPTAAQAPIEPAPKHRLTHVDGLRGVAAMLVLISHYLEQVAKLLPGTPSATALNSFVLDPFSLGRFGVVAFFCVSGFVIPFSFPGVAPKRGFLISRLFRLYPAYWLAVVGAAVVFPIFAETGFNAAIIGANLTMFQRVFGQPDMIGVFWTLRAELVFYAVCFVIFMTGRLHEARTQFLAMTCFLVLAIGLGALHVARPGMSISNALPTYLAAMHFGTIMRLIYLEGDASAARLYLPALITLALGVVIANVLGFWNVTDLPVLLAGATTSYLIAIGAFLACIHYKLFRQAAFVWLGSVSYSLYLFHGITLPLVPYAAERWGSSSTVFAVSGLAVLSLSLGTAWLSYRFVEKPAVGMGRSLISRLPRRLSRVHAHGGEISGFRP